jgi:hypothetical protein
MAASRSKVLLGERIWAGAVWRKRVTTEVSDDFDGKVKGHTLITLCARGRPGTQALRRSILAQGDMGAGPSGRTDIRRRPDCLPPSEAVVAVCPLEWPRDAWAEAGQGVVRPRLDTCPSRAAAEGRGLEGKNLDAMVLHESEMLIRPVRCRDLRRSRSRPRPPLPRRRSRRSLRRRRAVCRARLRRQLDRRNVRIR